MWNYRAVRKKHVWQDPQTQEERVSYTYGIHEAFYDEGGKVSVITENPMKPCGETIEELRHNWMMMAEAFGQPLLDYDDIPEPGYVKEDDSEKIEADAVSMDEMMSKTELSELLAKIEADMAEKRVASEQQHQEFVGSPTFEALLKKIYDDYNLVGQGEKKDS